MGMEILIPSGILCIAMAKVKLRPRVVLVELAKKVAIPSGILCNIIATIDIMPTLYKLSLLLLGKYLSINMDIIIPTIMLIKEIIITIIPWLLLFNRDIDSGIKSHMETVNITEEANAREEMRIFLFLSFLKNINMVPSKVDKPARNVNIKLIIILFIL